MSPDRADALGRSLSLLESMSSDPSIPRSLRKEAGEIMESLKDESKSLDLMCSEVIVRLEIFSRDPNIPARSREIIWQIVGDLSVLS